MSSGFLFVNTVFQTVFQFGSFYTLFQDGCQFLITPNLYAGLAIEAISYLQWYVDKWARHKKQLIAHFYVADKLLKE